MASSPRAVKGLKLVHLPGKTPFDSPNGSRLPEAYKEFYREWKWLKPAAVHSIPPASKYERNAKTGEIKLTQDYPIPVLYPQEHNEGLWGGEGVIKGFQKRHPLRRRVPHFWVPTLKKSVVYSEVLDLHIAAVVTDRFLRLVHENAGFDFYLLKTPACDLKSELAFKFKRKILVALANQDLYPNDDKRKREILAKYGHYLQQYGDVENIDWYGLTLKEAFRKQFILDQMNNSGPKPLKNQYRLELIQRLQEAGIKEASAATTEDQEKSWLSKINPFHKVQSMTDAKRD